MKFKTIIEPFLSKQWFVRMGDVPGGVVTSGSAASSAIGTGRRLRDGDASPGAVTA